VSVAAKPTALILRDAAARLLRMRAERMPERLAGRANRNPI